MYTALLSTLLLALLNTHSTLASCAHGTHLHRREEHAAGMVKIPDFSYSKTRGPTNWHGITPENEKCATGKTQSPIILDSTGAIEGAGSVKMEIETTHVIEFENLGTTVEVVVEGKTKVGNDTFAFK
jgi:carbonic anhydrase